VTTADVTATVTEIQATGDSVLEIVAAAVPGVALEAGAAEQVLNLLATLVGKALTAYAAASGTPITAASVLALLPDATPLSPPDAPESAPQP
jgi:hypothetical protein